MCLILIFTLLGSVGSVGSGASVLASQAEQPVDSESSESEDLTAEVAPLDEDSELVVKSTLGQRFRSLLGIVAFIGLCILLSNSRSNINWRTVFWGVGLQFFLGFLILKTKVGREFTSDAKDVFNGILKFSEAGTAQVFGTLPAVEGVGFQLWILLLGTIIFVSAVMAVLYHLGVLQFVVWCFARVMQKTMGTSGPESLAAAANIFAGQTEAPLVIRPYLKKMTDSQVMALMTGGMATVAGSVFAAYVGLGISAEHLMAASFMSAPAALLLGKVLIPEKPGEADTSAAKLEIHRTDSNLLDAACRGTSEGLKLALNVIAMLIAFVALVACINGALDWITGDRFNLQTLFSYLFWPFAWLLGVDQQDVSKVASLIGTKTVLNEFVAFLDLAGKGGEGLTERSRILATYALCGFANFASVAIQIGGISSLEPELRPRLAAMGLKALLGGTLAALMTGCVVGVLL
ncbi:MAG: hypothetical protein CBC13_03165 [Planctomycetia bacterium TMED53]|nr:MAG: hypothetical protein CBC13_03165 [Planctomycetia bacterium TMED53]